MSKRFTDRARKVMQLANQKAQRLGDEYIGTEHILRGLVQEGGGAAADVLKDFGVPLHAITTELDKLSRKRTPSSSLATLPQTPRAKQVIEYAIEEARNLDHDDVGTEDILLGLLCEDEGCAAQVLMNLGLRLKKVRAQIRACRGRFDSEGHIRGSNDDSPSSMRQIDDNTKRRVRQLAEELAPIQRAKEDAVASHDFQQAARLRDDQDRRWKRLQSFNLPELVLANVKRLINDSSTTGPIRFPLLETLRDEVGEPDQAVLALFPRTVISPVKLAVAAIPLHPVSTLKAALASEDIGSRYFQALVPSISPESVALYQDNSVKMIRSAFIEIGKAESLIYGRPIVLCIVRPSALAENVREELFASIHRTNCDFVVFDERSDLAAAQDKLPQATKLLGD